MLAVDKTTLEKRQTLKSKTAMFNKILKGERECIKILI